MPHEIVWEASESSRVSVSFSSGKLYAVIADYYWSGSEVVTIYAIDSEGLTDSVNISFTQVQPVYDDWGDVPTVEIVTSSLLTTPGSAIQVLAQVNGAISQQWTFEGADIETSTRFIEEVNFDSPGAYTITLSASNPYGTTEVTETIQVFGILQGDIEICSGASTNL